MDISKEWEKLIVVVVALVTIYFAQSYIRQSQAYGSKFAIQTVVPSNELPEMEKETVVTSSNLVEKKSFWTLPERGNPPRPIPLFKSITIVEIQGELIDMSAPDAKKIRPPASNQWLLEHELNFLNASVLERDPDQDGFTTLEEWNAKTLPRDPASHPPFADKLVLLARRQKNYILEFAAQPDEARFQIIRYPSSGVKRGTFIMRKGETSPDNKFRIDKFEKKQAVNNLGINADASELTITYLADGREVKLVRRVKNPIPTYFAEFKLKMRNGGEKFHVKKGETFRLPIDPETEYKLIDIDPQKAVISFESEPGKEVTIEIKLGE
ncbi:MAG: hypothetical protein L3J39_05395 [Verrucomicrobiales bacterium]|nr:hypothetical protein [Verrucomicrobiales bacterium]